MAVTSLLLPPPMKLPVAVPVWAILLFWPPAMVLLVPCAPTLLFVPLPMRERCAAAVLTLPPRTIEPDPEAVLSFPETTAASVLVALLLIITDHR